MTVLSLRLAHLDDETTTRLGLDLELERLAVDPPLRVQGFEASTPFLAWVASERPDVALVDIHLGDGDERNGIDVIRQLARRHPAVTTIAVSNDLGALRDAVLAGAADFISKQAPAREIAMRVHLLHASARGRVRAPAAGGGVGRTGAAVAARVQAILGSAVRSVLVTGETGVGKEVVAQCFERQLRGGTPFVKVNCAALSVSLLEAELFGHAKGAFTGAQGERTGFVEAASGGWLYLDEIHYLPAPAQAALLRALESGEIVRLGEHRARSVNVHVLSASNRDLSAEVTAGRFKGDLLQRLREAVIALPPLRERADEVEPLIDHFLATEDGGPYEMSREARQALKSYDWAEGNVRELRSCIRAMTERRIGHQIAAASLPAWLLARLHGSAGVASTPSASTTSDATRQLTLAYAPRTTFEELSGSLLQAMVETIRRERPGVSLRDLAEELGVTKSTLFRRLKLAGDESA